MIDLTAPELILAEEIGVKTGYYTEVVAAPFEGTEKARVACAGSSHDGTVSKDDFIGGNVVAGEAVATGEE